MREVVLYFRKVDESGFKVHCDGVCVGSFNIPVELKDKVATLKFQELDSFGARLSEAFFGACPSLVELIRGLRGQSVRFVLEFGEGAEYLLNFPWEFLKHPDFPLPLSLEFTFIRRIGEVKELDTISERPLKVLVVICEPITLVEFDGRRFHDVIAKEARPLVEKGLLQLEFLKLPSTPSEFSRRILEDCPDVVHFIGHGNVGVLCFEDEDGGVSDVSSDRFYSLCAGTRKPRLVILTACFSGAVSGGDLISGTATALVKAGVPSVLAMQVPIGIESAYELVGDLYAGLLSMFFDDLIKGLRASRFFAERIYLPAQWGIPVLYVQCNSERLFEGISNGEGFVKGWAPVSPCLWVPELGLFVGREEKLLEINSALRDGNLLVLDGLSGMGKSALAKKFCHWHKSRGSFSGGTVWIDLRTSEGIKWECGTVLEKIGLALNVSMNNLKGRLDLEPTLLVLDSYEELIGDRNLASFLTDLPKSSKVILTTVKSVDFARNIRVEEMKENDAIKYFYLRALKAGWDRAGEEYVPEICEQLGYMPLCIELIAPMTKKFPLIDLAEQVEQNLKVISAEMPHLPKHQQSIETALGFSYGFLLPMEQRLLAIMSIFSGRIYPKFLAGIADVSESDTLMLLGNLHDSGLVNFDGERYYLHTMVRRFASERLEKDFKEREKYEKRFAEFFYALCSWAISVLDKGKESRVAVGIALMESSNLLLAQEILSKEKKEKPNVAFSFSMALDQLFTRAGLWQSRIKAAKVALEIAKKWGRKEALVEAYNRLGLAHDAIGQASEALRYLQNALEIAKTIGDKLGEANQLGNIGIVLCNLGRFEEALKKLEDSLQIHKEIGSRLGEANQLGNIGIVLCNLGRFEEALKNHQNALKIDKEIGSRLGEAQDFGNIGNVLRNLGRFEEALKNHQDSLQIHKEIGNRLGEANQLGNIGNVLYELGRLEEAFSCILEASYLFHEIKSPEEQKVTRLLKEMHKKLSQENIQKILSETIESLRNYYQSNIQKT